MRYTKMNIKIEEKKEKQFSLIFNSMFHIFISIFSLTDTINQYSQSEPKQSNQHEHQ